LRVRPAGIANRSGLRLGEALAPQGVVDLWALDR
jgi:hypothetical protein